MEYFTTWTWLYTSRGDDEEEEWITPETGPERFAIPPEQMANYLAMVGDSSDNIPGVPGIGKGTAPKVRDQLPTLKAALEDVENGRAGSTGARQRHEGAEPRIRDDPARRARVGCTPRAGARGARLGPFEYLSRSSSSEASSCGPSQWSRASRSSRSPIPTPNPALSRQRCSETGLGRGKRIYDHNDGRAEAKLSTVLQTQKRPAGALPPCRAFCF